FLAFVCLSVTFLLMPFYLEDIVGLQVGFVGLLLGVQPLVMGLVSPVSGSLSDRIGIRRLTLIGLAIVLVALLVFRSFVAHTTPAQFLLFAIPLGLGLGIFQSPNTSSIMGSVPPRGRISAAGSCRYPGYCASRRAWPTSVRTGPPTSPRTSL